MVKKIKTGELLEPDQEVEVKQSNDKNKLCVAQDPVLAKPKSTEQLLSSNKKYLNADNHHKNEKKVSSKEIKEKENKDIKEFLANKKKSVDSAEDRKNKYRDDSPKENQESEQALESVESPRTEDSPLKRLLKKKTPKDLEDAASDELIKSHTMLIELHGLVAGVPKERIPEAHVENTDDVKEDKVKNGQFIPLFKDKKEHNSPKDEQDKEFLEDLEKQLIQLLGDRVYKEAHKVVYQNVRCFI